MEYRSLKESLLDFKRDLIRYPARTSLILLILLAIYFLSIIVPKYIDHALDTSPSTSERKEEITALANQFPTTQETTKEGLSLKYLNENGINVKGEPYSVDGSYPIFGIQKLDEKIAELIDTHRKIAQYGDSDTQSHFYVDFEKPFVSNKIISIEFSLSHIGNDRTINQGRDTVTIVGINFDPVNNKFYSVEDLPQLTGLSLKKVAQEVNEKLTEENGGSEISLEPNIENFSNFVINEKDVVFIYQRYAVLAGAAGTPRIPIPRTK